MAPKALVIEDDPITGELCAFLLQENGFEVQLIQDGSRAMDAVRVQRPDIVILDIIMPGVDGLTLCRWIKQDPDLASIRIAVVSAKSFADERARAAEYGADLFIAKPFKTEIFPGLIRTLLGAKMPKPDAR